MNRLNHLKLDQATKTFLVADERSRWPSTEVW